MLLYNLTDGAKNAGAESLYVSDTDIYVAGFERSENNLNVAKLWKNGEAIDLSDGQNTSTAHAVFVYEKDVYVAGKDGKKAKVWKNEKVLYELNSGSRSASAYGLFVK
ncbi:hypothetical protein [Flagellimonas sp. S3867]|uniref:hypothetical protein n=1 Tax=Flagellimonas sp. S3867 TaxID=2768063 RepID=UPI001CC24D9B|nr:hypothetical protein [Flagellimonas sp. S3867]